MNEFKKTLPTQEILDRIKDITKYASENLVNTNECSEQKIKKSLGERENRFIGIDEYFYLLFFELHRKDTLIRHISVAHEDPEKPGFMFPKVLESVGFLGIDLSQSYIVKPGITSGAAKLSFIQPMILKGKL